MLSNDDRPPIHAAFPSVGETHVAVSRSELDHWLLNEAVAAGAHLLEGGLGSAVLKKGGS
jgi:flavin-dependent dehydrogenase